MSDFSIDGIDKTILRALMKDARTPILEIARSVGISGAPDHLECACARRGVDPYLRLRDARP